MKKTIITKYLSKNIKLIGRLLGEVIKEKEGKKIYNLVENFRIKSRKSRSKNNKPNKKLLKKISTLNNNEKILLAQAFTEFLRLSNLAEQVHRIRVKRNIYKEKKIQSHSIQEILYELKDNSITSKHLEKILNKDFQIELVFTAHPTEILLPKQIAIYQLIAKLLLRLDQNDLSLWENQEIKSSIKRKIYLLWNSDFLRDSKPTPLDESEVGLEFSEKILWKTLPNFYKDLKSSFYKIFNKELTLKKEIFTFASWMGGDRDGNPHVTSNITDKIIRNSTQRAIKLYKNELKKLLENVPSIHITKSLKYIENLEKDLNDDKNLNKYSKKDFINLLEKARTHSLENKEIIWAEGPINDLIIRAKSFGLSLLKIDLRENSQIHRKIVNEYFTSQKIDYLTLNSNEKIKLLIKSCQDNKIQASKEFQKNDILLSLKLKNKYPSEFFNSYIISMTEKPEDILEVYFLYHIIGIKNPLQVVPLFETPESLENAPEILKTLFSNKWFIKLINKKQEIMIGYSDSGKRSGRFHAAWSLKKAQTKIIQIAKQYKIDLNFFHGKGGSIARGGGPIRLSMLTLENSKNMPKIRITEQGESVRNKFGLPQIAKRTLNLYFTGYLESIYKSKKDPKFLKKFDSFMEMNTKETHLSYKKFLENSDAFIDFYSKSTPVEELSLLNIGSRPSRRKKTQSIDDLRAIPWVFSWTQNRTLLPAWLGCEALIQSQENIDKLSHYYKKSSFFYAKIELINIALAKADMEVFKLYVDKLLPKEEKYINLKKEIIKKYSKSKKILTKITKSNNLLEKNPVLKRSIKLRTPYVDVLNLLQIHTLYEYRNNNSINHDKLLATTIAGIAAGMNNSG